MQTGQVYSRREESPMGAKTRNEQKRGERINAPRVWNTADQIHALTLTYAHVM